MTDKFIGTRIKAARERKHWRQARLAKEINVSSSAVNQWEAGETKPNSENVRQAAIALGVGVEWLATGRGSPNFGVEIPHDSQLSLPIGDPAAQINHIFQILVRLEAKIDALAQGRAFKD